MRLSLENASKKQILAVTFPGPLGWGMHMEEGTDPHQARPVSGFIGWTKVSVSHIKI